MNPLCVPCAVFCAVCAGNAAVVLDAPGHVRTDREATAARGGEPGAGWTLLDWRGRETGVSGSFDDGGETVIPPLPTGYYVLWGGRASARAADAGDGGPPVRLATLAVVPPPETRPFVPDSFFGIDTAQSQCAAKGRFDCPWNGGDTFLTVSDLVRLAGFRHVRERMSWGRVNPEPGVFDYGDCRCNADLLRARGAGVSGLFYNAPAWMAGQGAAPSDLAAVYDACVRFAADFGGGMEDWECWNEPDLAAAPVWDHAAAFKAASLGLRAGRPETAVLPGSLCSSPKAGYMRILHDNDAAKFGDAFNYHTYANPAGYPEVFASLRAFLEERGVGDRAVWVTECGTNLEGPAADDGAKAGLKAHSPAQELVLAEFYPKSQIALMMEGAARGFFFLLCPYNERGGTKDWGAMRRDGTVKPVYAAMSAMTRELAAARLGGELKAGHGLRAYLFDQPDGSQTVAFWSVSPVDTATGDAAVSPEPDFAREWRLALPCGEFQRKAAKSECSQSFTNDNCSQMANAANVAFAAENAKVTLDFQFVDNDEQLSFVNNSYRLSDLCGTVSTAVADADGVLSLPATRFPSYVSGLRGLAADVPPHPAGRVRRYEPGEDEDLSVVLRVDLDREDFSIGNGRTCARMKGDAGRLRVQVWNLGDAPKTGRVEVSGAALEGLPGIVALGPRGTPPAEFDCVLGPGADASATPTLVLAGVFDGRRSSRLAVPLLFEKRLFDGCETVSLAWKNRANWTRNDSAGSHAFAWDGAEAAWRWDVAWTDPAANRWFYPVYALAPGESLEGAVAIQFEAKSSQDKVENDFGHGYCMLLGGGSDVRWLECPPPVETWEKRVVLLRGGDVPANVTAFRIGANPKGMKLSFWIRNLEIIRHGQRD